MAPDVETFQKIEIMCMTSLFLPDLELNAVGTPELRIVAPEAWGMALTQKARMCIAPELRIATPRSWLRCIFEDYTQTSFPRRNLAGGKTSQGIRLNIYVMLRLTKAFRS